MNEQPINPQVPGGSIRFLEVYVGSPEKTLFEGLAKAVSSFNDIGPFDVLGRHENFISTIKNSLRVTLQNGEKREYKIGNGIMRVNNNIVQVFLGIDYLKKSAQQESSAT